MCDPSGRVRRRSTVRSFDAPHQISLRRLGHRPHLIAKEIAVRQAERPRLQRREDGLAQGDLTGCITLHLATEQNMRTILDQ